jgi:tetratricopeptide (TPR) repeat protein
MADRFTYLPQIGVCMALAWAMADVCRSWPGHRLTCGVASAVMLAVLTGCAWRQTSFWRDGETLWNQALACTPRNEAAHNLLGLALVTQSRFDEAIAHYQQALEILPRYSVTHINLGTALQSCGRTKDAIAQYEQALAIKPNSVRVHHNLAVILADQGRFDEAVAHYQRAVEIKPDFAEAHNGLGTVLGRRGKFDEAITHFQRALAIRPDFALAHANLGTALQLQGKIDQAIAQFQQALEIEPDKLKNHKNLANALACRGRFGEAISHIRQVLNLEPDDADAHRSLAWLLATCPEASLRNGDEAIEHARRASQRYGDQPVFIDALAAAYAEAGRFPEALATERKALDLASRQNNQPLADALRARIALYKAGKPYRETPPVTARKATNIQPSTKASSQP